MSLGVALASLRGKWLAAALPLACLITPLAAHAQDISIEDMSARLNKQKVTGATIIVHGYQFSGYQGDGLMDLAQAIVGKTGAWLLDYDLRGGTAADRDGSSPVFDGSHPVPGPAEENTPRHVVLLWDWACESNERTAGWGGGAGDALFAIIVKLGLGNPKNHTAVPLHFIAHSFGSAVVSEAVKRLAYYEVPVDQVTYLDPHDFDQAGVPVDEDQKLFTLGSPAGYGAAVWNNVSFADCYYQTRGANSPAWPNWASTDVPNGRPIPGAYNYWVNAELPASGSAYGAVADASGDHTFVWDSFYQGTVLGALPPGRPTPATSPSWASTGWQYSKASGANLARPAPVFYGPSQSHKYSESSLVIKATGAPNAAGLAAAGLTENQITNARWPSTHFPYLVYNGAFEFWGSRAFADVAPGWSNHGGGGDGDIDPQGPAINHNVWLNKWDEERIHNWCYIPYNATDLVFARKISIRSSYDILHVEIGGTEIKQYNQDPIMDWAVESVPIPEDLRDTVQTIKFWIEGNSYTGVNSEAQIDNVGFALVIPPIIQGVVREANGNPIPNCVVIPSQGDPILTDAGGAFTFKTPNMGWSGSLVAQKAGWKFVPASRTYNNLTSNQTGQDFVGGVVLRIGEAKLLPDNSSVYLTGDVKTAKLPGAVQIQEPDRSAGITVVTNDAVTPMMIDVLGVIQTSDGVRELRNTKVMDGGALVPPVAPIDMTNREVGGTKWGDFTPGVTGSVGLNNIGLLARVQGKVVYADMQPGGTYFAISDGSTGEFALIDAYGLQHPAEGDCVAVTGISSLYKSSGKTLPKVVVTRQYNIVGCDDIPNPVCNEANGHCYEVVPFSGPWDAAWSLATTRFHLGKMGHLTTITDAGEKAFIDQNMARINPNNLRGWLGGIQLTSAQNYQEPAGGWTWVTDEPWFFTDWHTGEPNQFEGRPEDYLQTYPDNNGMWRWNDLQQDGNELIFGMWVEYDDIFRPEP